jgi:DNA-binding beta-propeller fold protein YncE
MRALRLSLLLALAGLPAWGGPAGGPARIATSEVVLSGAPFGVALSPDDRFAFVALFAFKGHPDSGIAVLENKGGSWAVRDSWGAPWNGCHCELSHDGTLLAIAASDRAVFYQVSDLESGRRPKPVGVIPLSEDSEVTYLALSLDDRLVYVAEEAKARISVYDLAAFRAGGWKAAPRLGAIPTGSAPVGVLPSADGRFVYAVSEVGRASWGWPAVIPDEEGHSRSLRPEGALSVIDAALSRTDPAHAVLANVRCGGGPVRLALSPGGGRLYVACRASQELRVFDTSKLPGDREGALLARTPVGPAPVPVALMAGGELVVVGNSDRFDNGRNSSLWLWPAPREGAGFKGHLVLPSAGFPREFAVTKDGTQLLATNFLAGRVTIVDVRALLAPRP